MLTIVFISWVLGGFKELKIRKLLELCVMHRITYYYNQWHLQPLLRKGSHSEGSTDLTQAPQLVSGRAGAPDLSLITCSFFYLMQKHFSALSNIPPPQLSVNSRHTVVCGVSVLNWTGPPPSPPSLSPPPSPSPPLQAPSRFGWRRCVEREQPSSFVNGILVP